VFYRNDDETRFVSRRTKSVGWWSGKETKRLLLADYRKALVAGTFINRSAESYVECTQYVHEPTGEIKHSKAKTTIDPASAGENHGDIVIADALACRGLSEIRAAVVPEENKELPINSFGYRFQERRKREKQRTRRLGEFARIG
jgi:hypothetical protein